MPYLGRGHRDVSKLEREGTGLLSWSLKMKTKTFRFVFQLNNIYVENSTYNQFHELNSLTEELHKTAAELIYYKL